MSEEQIVYPKKLMIVTSIIFLIFAVVLVWSVICLYKIYKRFKFSDKILIISIGCVITSLISIQISAVFLIVIINEKDQGTIYSEHLMLQLWGVFITLQIMTMFNSFIFDIYRWAIFIICSDNSNYHQNESIDVEIKQKKLQKLIFLIQFIVLTIFGTIIIGMSLSFNLDALKLWYEVKTIVTIVCFSGFLVAYLIVFGVLMVRLQTYYPVFYKYQKKRIIKVASLLIFSMVSKILVQSIYSVPQIQSQLIESLVQDTWYYPMLQFYSISTTIILPLCVMTYSLMQTLTERKLMTHRHSQRSELVEDQNNSSDEEGEKTDRSHSINTFENKKFSANDVKIYMQDFQQLTYEPGYDSTRQDIINNTRNYQ